MALRTKTYHYMFTPRDKYQLFMQLVEPVFSYGCEVWGHEPTKKMELLQYLREILGVQKLCRIDLLYQELGTIPLRPRRIIRMVSFWASLAVAESKKLSSEIYRTQRVQPDFVAS